MSQHAVDYSWSHPDPAAMQAAGVKLVIRYTTGTKALSAAEATALRAHDIAIALVFETSIQRANTGGVAGGTEDAAQARDFGASRGYPSDGVIFFACDTGPILDRCRKYFQGVRGVLRHRSVGWYGGMGVGLQLQAEGLVDVVWVANAASWSGYRHWTEMAVAARANPRVSVLQSLDHPLPGLTPGAYDYDELLRPFPAWGMSVTPDPVPVPVPPYEQHPAVNIGDKVNRLDITGIHLDDQGCGFVDVRGVTTATFEYATIFGGTNPSDPAHPGYQKTPRTRVVSGRNPARVVITDGEPGGVYTLRVGFSG